MDKNVPFLHDPEKYIITRRSQRAGFIYKNDVEYARRYLWNYIDFIIYV